MAIFRGNKKLTETEPQPATLSQVNGDVWMYGSSLPLDAFPGLGDYRIEITLRDSASSLRRTTSIPVTIAAP